MTHRIITPDNWTFCRYEAGLFRAFVSFGAEPATHESEDIRYIYYVTVTEGEDHEVFQATYPTLNQACLDINQRYGDWPLLDQTAPKSGCGSCAAH